MRLLDFLLVFGSGTELKKCGPALMQGSGIKNRNECFGAGNQGLVWLPTERTLLLRRLLSFLLCGCCGSGCSCPRRHDAVDARVRDNLA